MKGFDGLCCLCLVEDVTKNILKDFLARYGKVQDSEKEKKRLGMTFNESSVAIVNDYELPLTRDEYVQEILPMYHGTWVFRYLLARKVSIFRHSCCLELGLWCVCSFLLDHQFFYLEKLSSLGMLLLRIGDMVWAMCLFYSVGSSILLSRKVAIFRHA